MKQKILKICKDRNIVLRENQLGAIENIVNSIISGDNHLVDAPTGSGKSIIAIVAGLTLQSMGKRGYILVSDLELFEQYQTDKFFPDEWGYIKGIDNYTCNKNGEKISIGECKLKKLKARDLDCYGTCKYYAQRDWAKEKDIVMMTYKYWIIMQDYVNRKMPEAAYQIFDKRDFVICDEAHNTPMIFQDHFSPNIPRKCLFTELRNLAREESDKLNYKIFEGFESNWAMLWNNLYYANKENLYPRIVSLYKYMAGNNSYYSHLDTKKCSVGLQIHIGKVQDRIKDILCKIEDYIELADGNTYNIVKTNEDTRIILNYLDSTRLLKQKLYKNGNSFVFLSATFGNTEKWNCPVTIVPNTFNFAKSPIILAGSENTNLAMGKKEKNRKSTIKLLKSILNNHKSENGIIHTNSYEFVELVKETGNKRIITYTDGASKKAAIEKFRNEGGILVGPSLTEGLNFPDEQCRFQILLKVPYGSLGSNYLKALSFKYRDEYNYRTTLKVLQSIGRGIRHRNDWCVTYLIDGGFKRFLNNKSVKQDMKFVLKRLIEK